MSGSVTKGWIKNLSSGEKKSFQYNPDGITYTRSANFVDIVAPGMPYPNTQFVNGGVQTFSVDIFLYDRPYTGVIPSWMNFIDKLLPPEKNNSGYTKPPEFTFCYGTFIKRCVLTQRDVSIQMSDGQLRPTKAVLSLQIRQVGV